MKQPVFEGTATALVTPFQNGTVDYSKLEQLLDFQIVNGISAVVVCGTTGESASMTDQEKLGAIAHAVQYVRGRCKVIAGTGSNSTSHAAELSRMAESVGADALLVVTPYYNRCTQDGLILHYTAIADAVQIPVILYNVPSRTSMDISPEVCAKLSSHPNVNGIKEASADIRKVSRILNVSGPDFHVWSGNDDTAVAAMALGASGLISVLSNVRPKQTDEMVQACRIGDYKKAAAMQQEFMPLLDILFREVNPIPVKEALNLLGFDVGDPRLPLTRLSEPVREQLKELILS